MKNGFKRIDHRKKITGIFWKTDLLDGRGQQFTNLIGLAVEIDKNAINLTHLK
jgi:hypothetical protein